MVTPQFSNIDQGWIDLGSGFRTPVNSTASTVSQVLDSGRSGLLQGSDSQVILLNIARNDINYEVEMDVIENVLDPTPNKIFVANIAEKTQTSFTILLNAAPLSSNYILPWRIKPLAGATVVPVTASS